MAERTLGLLLTTVVTVSVLAEQSAGRGIQRAPAPQLQIVVLAGEDAVNVIQQQTAVAPLVEVRDRNNQPVAGVAVTFTIQGGRNAAFAAGANSMTVTTNALGQAAVTGLTPTSAGAVQINVAAAFQGQTATAAITQTNFMTAAQAASASAGGSSASGASAGGGAGGGGGIGAGTITALGAAAAGGIGGWYGYKKYQQGDPPVLSDVGLTQHSGLALITPIQVHLGNATWHGEGASLRVDFGDGFQSSVSLDFSTAFPEVTHIYRAPGTYTIRATLVDAWDRTSSAQASITIKDLNGRWNLGNTANFFTLVQNGFTLSGVYTAANGLGSGIVTGSVREQTTNNLAMSVTPSGAGPASSYLGSTLHNSADVILGSFTSGTTVSSVSLTRQ